MPLENAKIINFPCKQHTLNREICGLMFHIFNEFDGVKICKTIDNLISNGATICNKDDYNTLSMTLKYVLPYLPLTSTAENNIMVLLQFLVYKGAEPSGSQSNFNTLSNAV